MLRILQHLPGILSCGQAVAVEKATGVFSMSDREQKDMKYCTSAAKPGGKLVGCYPMSVLPGNSCAVEGLLLRKDVLALELQSTDC